MAVEGVGACIVPSALTTSAERLQSLVWSLVLAGAALLFTRKSAMAQALARGAAWSVILPTVLVGLVALAHGFHPGLPMMFPAAAAAGALVLARPLLGSDEARATFAPIALRSWLLASATAAIGTGLAMARLAMAFGAYFAVDALALGCVAGALVASGIGVVRMRAWGVLAGALSSVIALLTALHFRAGGVLGWPVLATMIPGLMMIGGVIAARAGVGHPKEVLTARVAARIRVDEAADELQVLDLEEDDALVLDGTARARS